MNLADLIADRIGLGSQLEDHRLLAVEIFLVHDGNQIPLFDVLALRAEAQQHVLIDHLAVLAEVVFFDAIDFWVEEEQVVAFAQNRARIRLGDFDAHLLVVANKDMSRFRGRVFYHRGVLDVFKVGRQRVEVLRGLVHHAQHAFNGPFRIRLSMKGRVHAGNAAQHCQRKGEQRITPTHPRRTQYCVPHKELRNPNIYKEMRERAEPFRAARHTPMPHVNERLSSRTRSRRLQRGEGSASRMRVAKPVFKRRIRKKAC